MKKMSDESNKIDYAIQKLHIKNFIKDYWDFSSLKLVEGSPYKSPLDALVEQAFDAGVLGATFWLNKYSPDVRNKAVARQDNLLEEDKEFFYYDDVFRHLFHIQIYAFMHNGSTLDENGLDWNYEVKVSNINKRISHSIENLNLLEPNNYKYIKNREINDLDYDLPNYPEFEGYEDSTSGSFPFYKRVKLKQVLWDDVRQGNKPVNNLIGSILAYGLNVREQNNTIEYKEELSHIDISGKFTSGEVAYPESQWFSLLKQYESEDKFVALTPELRCQLIKDKQEFENLSEEDKVLRKAESDKALLIKNKEKSVNPKPKHKFKVI